MAKKGMIFYDNWCDLVNEYYDDGDKDTAMKLAFAIIRLYSTGELIDVNDKSLNRMIEYTIMPGIESQIKNYLDGSKGGRPSVEITAEAIIEAKAQGKTWRNAAELLGISEDTLRKYRKELQIDAKQAEKPKNGPKNQEKEEEEEKDEENGMRASLAFRDCSLRSQSLDTLLDGTLTEAEHTFGTQWTWDAD